MKKLLPLARRPTFIIDSQREYTGGVRYKSYRHWIKAQKSGIRNETGIHIIGGRDSRAGDYERAIETVAKAKIGGSCLVVDEVDKFTTPGNIQVEGLEEVADYGAHWEQDFYCSARRPQKVAKDITANLDIMICLRTQQPRDVRRVYDTWGHTYGDPEKLRSLDDYHYMAFGNLEKFSERLSPLLSGKIDNLDQHNV